NKKNLNSIPTRRSSDLQNNTQNTTHSILKINTNVSKTNTTNPFTIQSTIASLKKQLFDAQMVINTTNTNIFKIQHQIDVLTAERSEEHTSELQSLAYLV